MNDSAFIEKSMKFISRGPFDHTSSLIQDLGLAASHYLSSPTRQRMVAHKCCLEIFIDAFMMTLRSRSATQRDKKTTSVGNRISGKAISDTELDLGAIPNNASVNAKKTLMHSKT